MRLSEQSPLPLFAPSVFARAFDALRSGCTLQKWSKKAQAPVARTFRLRIPTIPLDEDAEQQPVARAHWGVRGLLQPSSEEASTLSWEREHPGGVVSRLLPSAFAGGARPKVLNFRDVIKVDLWETSTANLIPGALRAGCGH